MNMPYEIDVASWDDMGEEDHIKFVDEYVSRMRAQGFEAQVVTYDGPAGGAAVVRFGPGTRSFMWKRVTRIGSRCRYEQA